MRSHHLTWALPRRVSVAVLVLGLSVVPADAQVGEGRLAGRVIDASTRGPIAGATVVLAPAPNGVLGGGGSGPATIESIVTLTDEAGQYRIEGLPRGAYRLTVERLGYRPAAVQAHVEGSSPRLTLSLTVEPIALEPVEVITVSSPPSAVSPSTSASSAAAALELRSALGLGTDAWIVDRRSVREASTSGEPDVLRALRRVPGLTGRDEYSAEVWVRGSGWSGSRLLLDDMPLYGPFLFGSAFTALPPAALGSGLIHTGPYPARLEGGSAGTVA